MMTIKMVMSLPTLTPEGYVPRLIDGKVDFMMGIFGAVCIEGPKGCGKTWTARNHASSEFNIADPRDNFNNLTMAQYNVVIVFEGEEPHLIDEWQECPPPVWDATKMLVDQKKLDLDVTDRSGVPESRFGSFEEMEFGKPPCGRLTTWTERLSITLEMPRSSF